MHNFANFILHYGIFRFHYAISELYNAILRLYNTILRLHYGIFAPHYDADINNGGHGPQAMSSELVGRSVSRTSYYPSSE